MLTLTAAFLLASSAGEDCKPTPLVDVIEFNSTSSGLDQIILWRFTPNGERVAEWMRAKDVEKIGSVVTWRSCRIERLFIARCRYYRRTHTQHDPELVDRAAHPPEFRVPYFD